MTTEHQKWLRKAIQHQKWLRKAIQHQLRKFQWLPTEHQKWLRTAIQHQQWLQMAKGHPKWLQMATDRQHLTTPLDDATWTVSSATSLPRGLRAHSADACQLPHTQHPQWLQMTIWHPQWLYMTVDRPQEHQQ